MSESAGAACVLIVDDDEDLRTTMAELLEDEGIAVATAANGELALRWLETNSAPEVILLDLMMPVMSGPEFREKQLLDPRFAGIPIVVLSASHDAGAQAREMRAAAFHAKPPRIDALLATLAEYC